MSSFAFSAVKSVCNALWYTNFIFCHVWTLLGQCNLISCVKGCLPILSPPCGALAMQCSSVRSGLVYPIPYHFLFVFEPRRSDTFQFLAAWMSFSSFSSTQSAFNALQSTHSIFRILTALVQHVLIIYLRGCLTIL